MPVAPSPQDLLDLHFAEALARQPRLRFREGDVSLAQAHGAMAMADAVIRYSAQAFRETFIDGARGDALTALVDDHLNIQRSAATAATVTCRFTRTSGGGAGSIPAGTVVATDFDADGNQVRFTTDAVQAVGAGNNGPWDVACTCEVTGPDGNVDAATIDRIVSTLFDSSFSVTNVAAAAGGNDEESDEELRLRARNFWLTLRRGTLAALEFGALEVDAVRIVKATEGTTGLVTVVVTDADGNSNAQMVSDVETELENWRAAGTVVQVVGGTPKLVSVAATLELADGVDGDVLAPFVEDAIEARMRKLRQGETLRIDQLTHAVVSVDPDGILSVSFELESNAIALGEVDVTPTAAQVVRPDVISVTW